MSNLSNLQISQVLNEYMEQVVPAMYREHYHLRLAKGGPDYPYLSEQSFFGHVINGVFGLAQILKFVVSQRIFVRGLNEFTFRKALALYSIHDLHKFNDYEKLGSSEFSVPLERLREEYERLELAKFAGELDANIMRHGNVSKRSPRQGDVLRSNEELGAKLWIIVRIADTIASVTSPAEAVSALDSYLKCLAPEFKTEWKLYTHELQDIRGVLNNVIHSAVNFRLAKELHFRALLFFASGTLYIGSKNINEFSRENLIENLVRDVLHGLVPSPEVSKSAAADGLRETKYDFQLYVHAFSSLEDLLEIVLERTQRTSKPNAKKVSDDVKQISQKKSAPPNWADTFESRFKVSLSESKDFNEKWFLIRQYMLYLDSLLKILAPNFDLVAWYTQLFGIPDSVTSELRKDLSLFDSGHPRKRIIIPAYYFLKGSDFVTRSAEAYDYATVLQTLHEKIVNALKDIDTQAGRQSVFSELGFSQDLNIYLNEQLYLSFANTAELKDDSLAPYTKQKIKSHSNRICSVCNRSSQYTSELRTGVLDNSGREFSNRVLPAESAPNDLRPWCPICHLEFIFRKLTGLGLPARATYSQSYRINIYAFPTFSFTSEHTRLLGRVLRPLQEVTALPIRDYGKDSPGLPQLWLKRGELDPEWIDTVVDVFTRETERIANQPGYVGERLLVTKPLANSDYDQALEESDSETNEDIRITPQPNYYLIPWERSVRDGEKDDARIPTYTEAWAKATFTAAVIASLTNSRVYVTERPYLPFASASELKATVTLDSPPPIITKLLGNEQDSKLVNQTDTISLYGIEANHKSGLERALDLCAALWVITTEVHRPESQTKDKQIASRLGAVTVEPLAGAHFYKEYGRLNKDASPLPVLTKACETLLNYFGGELMDLVGQITEKALAIWLPFREYGRGKAHNYELVFREAVDAMRSAFRLVPELRQLTLTSQEPSSEAIAEMKKQASGTLLKAMERRRATKRGDGIINPWQQDLGKLVGEFIDLVVDEVFLCRSDKSFAQFLRLENSLADGVYYCTDRCIAQKYEEWKAQREARAKSEPAD